jgi:cell division protein FtsB
MNTVRWPTIVLGALLLMVQADLWWGKGNWPYVVRLNKQLDQQMAANQSAKARNARTAAEVNDLKEGLEMVEEKARFEMGMLRENEILVKVTPQR